MNLKLLNDEILGWLSEFDVKDLPNSPNLNGSFNYSDITFAIVSGTASDDEYFMRVRVNFSVAANLRKNDSETSFNFTHLEISSLYTLVYEIVYRIHKRKVTGGGLLRITDFELFTPESGKWRALLTSEVDIPIKSAVDENPLCLAVLGE